MNNAIRLSEKWFMRGLWLIAVVFAFFLIGVGRAVVGDLPQVEADLAIEQFMPPAATRLNYELAAAAAAATSTTAQAALEQAELKRQGAARDYAAARTTFDNWVATRRATGNAGQDAELARRTRALDALKAAESDASRAAEAQRQRLLDARQAEERARAALAPLEHEAQVKLADVPIPLKPPLCSGTMSPLDSGAEAAPFCGACAG